MEKVGLSRSPGMKKFRATKQAVRRAASAVRHLERARELLVQLIGEPEDGDDVLYENPVDALDVTLHHTEFLQEDIIAARQKN